MRLKIFLAFLLNASCASILFLGGASGCGGGTSAAASTLEGTYDCIDGCDGDCIFSDTLAIDLGKSEDDGNTSFSVTGSISTASNTFDQPGAAGVNDDGNFGFVLGNLLGDHVSCSGPPVIDGIATLSCAGEEEINGVITPINCQEATYQKR